jgi:hypothetical protein
MLVNENLETLIVKDAEMVHEIRVSHQSPYLSSFVNFKYLLIDV